MNFPLVECDGSIVFELINKNILYVYNKHVHGICISIRCNEICTDYKNSEIQFYIART